jgi:hypothetical protein
MKRAIPVDINFRMKVKLNIQMLFCFFFIFIIFGIEAEELPDRINFGRSAKYGKFITAAELSVWGSSRNLKLIHDCPFKDLADYEAEVIPVHGMNFVMNAPGEGRVYLYLDMVTFLPSDEYEKDGEKNYCNQKKEHSSFSNKAALMQGIRWLEILVNGKSLRTIYEGNGTFIHSPIVVVIDREHMTRRKLEITLRPSPGESLFGIWDAFVVKSKIPDEEL